MSFQLPKKSIGKEVHSFLSRSGGKGRSKEGVSEVGRRGERGGEEGWKKAGEGKMGGESPSHV